MFANIPVVTKNILILNILLYAVIYIDAQSGGTWHHFLAAHFINSPLFEPFQIVSHMFMHSLSGIWHIFFNMFILVVFGSHLERVWGPKRYFIFYFAAGIGAFLLYNTIGFFPISELKEQLIAAGNNAYYIDEIIKDKILWNYTISNPDRANSYFYELYQQGLISESTFHHPQPFIDYLNYCNQGMVGASGALFGLLAAFAILFPNTQLMLLFPPIPIRAKYLIGCYLAYEIYMSFFSSSVDNIAHIAHVGGAIVGAILVLYWRAKDRTNFY